MSTSGNKSDTRAVSLDQPSSPMNSQAQRWNRSVAIMAIVISVVFVWSYWPTLTGMFSVWNSVADYSHGFLVAPVAAAVLWSRRSSMPLVAPSIHWSGLVLIALAAGMRVLAGRWFIEAIDGWSIVVWIAGTVLLFGGWPMLRWSAPAIGFLFFMVPLPFGMESALSAPLQQFATKASGWLLQCLGQPALAEKNTLLIGDQQLDIERACSGLRMFLGVLALAYVYAVFSGRPWWDKAAMLLATIPVAMLANTLRIVVTGLVFQFSKDKDFHQFVHDSAGWLTIIVAAAMMAALSFYLKFVLREVQVLEVRDLVRPASA